MKTFNHGFTVLKDAARSAPVTLAVFHFASGDVFVSDRDVKAGLDGPDFIGLVTSWGGIASPGRGPFSVGVPGTTLEIANGGAPPFSSLLESEGAGKIEVELFQWFEGLDYSEKEPLGRFVVVFPVSYTDTGISLTLAGSFGTRRQVVGRTIGRSEYPYADPDAIGRMESIVYGSPRGVPCRAVVAGGCSPLVSDITASQTAGIGLSLAPNEVSFPPSGTLQVGGEKISYTGIANKVLTGVTRGVSGSPASAHKKGAAAYEVRSDFTYLVAGHPVKAIGDVYVEGVRVTSGVSRYTDSGGKAKLVFSGKFTLEKSVGLSLTDPTHPHAVVSTKTQYNSATLPNVLTPNCTGASESASGTIAFPATPNKHAPVGINYEIGFQVQTTASGCSSYVPADIQMKIGGIVVFATGAYGSVNLPSPVQFSSTADSDTVAVYVQHGAGSNTYRVGLNILSAKRTLDVDTQTSSASTGVALSGDSAADVVVGGRVTCDVDGMTDDASGSCTGTPGALISNPADVIRHFMVNYMGMPRGEVGPSFDTARELLTSAIPGGYAFSGVIDSPVDVFYQLESWSAQARLKLTHDGYEARLAFLGNGGAAVKTIGWPAILKPGVRLFRTPLEELVNRLELYYLRDFTLDGAAVSGYTAIADASSAYPKDGDAASVALYGPRGPKRALLMGFVKDAAMASDLRDFYITRYKDVRRRVSLALLLDNLEIEEGDVIALDCPSDKFGLAGVNFIVEKVVFTPGGLRSGRPDLLHVQAREV